MREAWIFIDFITLWCSDDLCQQTRDETQRFCVDFFAHGFIQGYFLMSSKDIYENVNLVFFGKFKRTGCLGLSSVLIGLMGLSTCWVIIVTKTHHAAN